MRIGSTPTLFSVENSTLILTDSSSNLFDNDHSPLKEGYKGFKYDHGKLKPVDPIYCIRPNSIKTSCNWFKKNFPGKILYAVKTNPHEDKEY